MKRLTFLAFVCALIATEAGKAAGEPLPDWKLGDSMHIRVAIPGVHIEPAAKKAPEKQLVVKPKPLDIHVVVLGKHNVKGISCIKVDFILPGKKKPDAVESFRYRVCFDPRDGFPREAYSFKKYRRMPIREFVKARFLLAAPTGIPLDFLPLHEPMEAEAGNDKLTVKRETDMAGDIKQTTTFYRAKELALEIRQTWKKGEKWWRTYERYRKGKLDLRAWQVIKPPRVVKAPKKPAVEPPPPPKGKVKYPPFVDDTNNPLDRDKRLRVKVTMILRSPRPQHILARLEKATGLAYTMDDNINREKPVFTSAHFVNTQAVSVMKRLSENPGVKGRWEKTAAGYRLVGPERAAVATTREESPRHWSLWPYLAAGGLGIVGIGFGVLCVIALFRRPPAKPQTTSKK